MSNKENAAPVFSLPDIGASLSPASNKKPTLSNLFKSPKKIARSPFSEKFGFNRSLPDLLEGSKSNETVSTYPPAENADSQKGLEDILGVLDGKPRRESVGGILLFGEGSKNQSRLAKKSARRSSMNRRVSFATHAMVRFFEKTQESPQAPPEQGEGHHIPTKGLSPKVTDENSLYDENEPNKFEIPDLSVHLPNAVDSFNVQKKVESRTPIQPQKSVLEKSLESLDGTNKLQDLDGASFHESTKMENVNEMTMMNNKPIEAQATLESSDTFLRRRDLSHSIADASVPSATEPLTMESFPDAAAKSSSPTPAVWTGNTSPVSSSSDVEDDMFDCEDTFTATDAVRAAIRRASASVASSRRQSLAMSTSKSQSSSPVGAQSKPWSPSEDVTDMDMTMMTNNISLGFKYDSENDVEMDLDECATAAIQVTQTNHADDSVYNGYLFQSGQKKIQEEVYSDDEQEQTMEMTEVLNAFNEWQGECESALNSAISTNVNKDAGGAPQDSTSSTGSQPSSPHEPMEMTSVTGFAMLNTMDGPLGKKSETTAVCKGAISSFKITSDDDADSLIDSRVVTSNSSESSLTYTMVNDTSSDEEVIISKKQRIEEADLPLKGVNARALHDQTEEFLKMLESNSALENRQDDITLDLEITTTDFIAEDTEVVRQLLRSPVMANVTSKSPRKEASVKSEEKTQSSTDLPLSSLAKGFSQNDEEHSLELSETYESLEAVQPPIDLAHVTCSPMVHGINNTALIPIVEKQSSQNLNLPRAVSLLRHSMSNVNERTNAMRETTRRESMAIAARMSGLNDNVMRSKSFFGAQNMPLATPSMTPRRPQMPPPKALKLSSIKQPTIVEASKPAGLVDRVVSSAHVDDNITDQYCFSASAVDQSRPNLVKEFLSIVNVRFLDLAANSRRDTLVTAVNTIVPDLTPMQFRWLENIVTTEYDIYIEMYKFMEQEFEATRARVAEIEASLNMEPSEWIRKALKDQPEIVEDLQQKTKRLKALARQKVRLEWTDMRLRMLRQIQTEIYNKTVWFQSRLAEAEEAMEPIRVTHAEVHKLLPEISERLKSAQRKLDAAAKQDKQRIEDMENQARSLKETADLQETQLPQILAAAEKAKKRVEDLKAEISEKHQIIREAREKYEQFKVYSDRDLGKLNDEISFLSGAFGIKTFSSSVSKDTLTLVLDDRLIISVDAARDCATCSFQNLNDNLEEVISNLMTKRINKVSSLKGTLEVVHLVLQHWDGLQALYRELNQIKLSSLIEAEVFGDRVELRISVHSTTESAPRANIKLSFKNGFLYPDEIPQISVESKSVEFQHKIENERRRMKPSFGMLLDFIQQLSLK